MSESDPAAAAIAEMAAKLIGGTPVVHACQRMSSGYSNANYRLETSAGVFLLRSCSGRDTTDVEFELDVLDWLKGHAFPCAAALRFGGGERWVAADEGATVVLLEWLEGAEPVPNRAVVTNIARALGEFHRLPPPPGGWWRRENPNGREVAEKLIGSLESEDGELFRFFVGEFQEMRDRLKEPLPRGLIHGDLFTDNTLFQGDSLVALLDFEDACEDVLLFDVAMTIHGFCFPGEQWRPDLASELLGAYQEQRALTDRERALLPTYLCWCPLALLGWHLRQLLRRPHADNEQRGAELARRVARMKEANWPA